MDGQSAPAAGAADPLLAVDDLAAFYRTTKHGVTRQVRAVDHVSLAVKRDEIYGIAGESSSGKTSLIKVLAGAVKPPLQIVSGRAAYRFRDGTEIDLATASAEEILKHRWRYFSYVMQGSMSVLNPLKRIGSIVSDFAVRPLGLRGAALRTLAIDHFSRLQLDSRVLDAYPHELSGGMRQRVTIGLATLCKPELIIADEPTTALDVVVQKEVLGLLRELQQTLGASIILVTHDMSVHAHMAHRIGIVYAGRLVEEAPTRRIFTRPRHPYTAHLVASLPRIGDTTRRVALEGRPPNLADPPQGCRFHPRCPLAVDICKREAPPLETVAEESRVACWRWRDVVPLPGSLGYLDDRENAR